MQPRRVADESEQRRAQKTWSEGVREEKGGGRVTSGACKQSGQVVSGDDEGRRSRGSAGWRGSDKDGSLKTRREERLSKLGGEAPEMRGRSDATSHRSERQPYQTCVRFPLRPLQLNTHFALKQKNQKEDTSQTSSLTLAVAVHLLVPDATNAVAQRYQPGAVGAAVEFWRVPFLRVFHAGAPHLHQGGRVHVGHRVGKSRQVPQSRRAALVEDLAKEGERRLCKKLRPDTQEKGTQVSC